MRPKHSEPHGSLCSVERPRVLIVDDNVDQVDSLAILLEARGWEVSRAYDGAGALENVRGWSPQLALLDIAMPHMDGCKVARRLRDVLGRACKLIAMTGYADAAHRLRWAKWFDSYLVKPVEPRVLYELLSHERGRGRPRILAFDVDDESRRSLQQALPAWDLESVKGATAASLERDGNPGGASLLVVSARRPLAETLGLCRGLRSQAGQNKTPLLVLVPAGDDALVKAALAAGADSCLVLPVHAKDLAGLVPRVMAGNRPGRHTLHLDRAQLADLWRDDGGEG